jgi:hypothetical protein
MCHLLRMPAEKRNAIYAYALSFQYGLKYYHDRQFSTGHMQVADANLLTDPPIEWESEEHAVMVLHDANQLKFVNRHLGLDTRSLGTVVQRHHLPQYSGLKPLPFEVFNVVLRGFPHIQNPKRFVWQKVPSLRPRSGSAETSFQLLSPSSTCPSSKSAKFHRYSVRVFSPFFPQEATTLRYVLRAKRD